MRWFLGLNDGLEHIRSSPFLICHATQKKTAHAHANVETDGNFEPEFLSASMRIFSVVLIALGAGISGYLLYRHLAPDTVWGVSLCPTVFGKNCEDTLRSSLSVQLGLPLAGWGLVYYGTLAALLLLGWAVGDAFRFPATLGALFLSWIGAVISVGLLCSMVTGAAPLCPLCALVHVINFFLIFPLKRFTGRTVGQL